jgi:hypothetical protein
MDLEKYKEIIDELVSAKNSEKDPKRKRGLEDFEIRLRKDLRSREIQSKLKNLYDNKEFVGYICVASQFIEFKIKEIVLQLQQLAVLLNKDFKPDKDWEEKTLGGLITILENHCINDSVLIKQLKDFNDLRVKAIHRLFDTTFEINDVESEIETKLTPSFSYYNNIVAPLEKYLYGITVKTAETKNKMGQMPQEAKMAIEKIRKKMEEINPNLKDEDIIKNIKL